MKTALVTGASRGLGAEIAKELAALGYHVLTPTRQELDVSSGSSVSSYAPNIDGLDALVNNAAILGVDLYDAMETNAFGPYRLTRHLWPLLKARKGRVVNISSREGIVGDGFGHRPYSVSKTTLNAITKMMAKNDDGVSLVACCPGWFQSRLGGPNAPRTASLAAAWPVWLATESTGLKGEFVSV